MYSLKLIKVFIGNVMYNARYWYGNSFCPSQSHAVIVYKRQNISARHFFYHPTNDNFNILVCCENFNSSYDIGMQSPVTHNGGLKYRRVWKLRDFRPISRCISKTVRWRGILWNHMVTFRWLPVTSEVIQLFSSCRLPQSMLLLHVLRTVFNHSRTTSSNIILSYLVRCVMTLSDLWRSFQVFQLPASEILRCCINIQYGQTYDGNSFSIR